MFSHRISLRVRYSETDRMGYAYYGNYATYFEVARVEALRELGVNYRELEDNGILLPVFDFKIKYFKPAYYDDELTIEVAIQEMPKARICFFYKTFNPDGICINEGETTLVFVDKLSGKPRACPDHIIEKLTRFGL